MAAPPELIDVREDERFDEAALAAWLRGRLPGSEGPLQVRQFGGGHANLTYLLRYGAGEPAIEYVLRRPPLGPVAAGSHDMHREFRALSRLWQAFPAAPRAYLYCDDAGLLGAPFLVMERRHGVVVREAVPPELGAGRDPRVNRRLSEVLIDALAELHAVAPGSVGLEGLGRPEGFLERQVRGWTERLERARTREDRLADQLAAWLLRELPASGPATLLHNDWKLDNLAVAADDPGRCVAVYDWDMCTRGDPLADLGTLLAWWVEPGEPASVGPSMPSDVPGFMTRAEAIARYAARSGRDVSGAAYYQVFGAFKMAVVVQQIFFRFQRGQTRDSRFADMERAARGLFARAARRRP